MSTKPGIVNRRRRLLFIRRWCESAELAAASVPVVGMGIDVLSWSVDNWSNKIFFFLLKNSRQLNFIDRWIYKKKFTWFFTVKKVYTHKKVISYGYCFLQNDQLNDDHRKNAENDRQSDNQDVKAVNLETDETNDENRPMIIAVNPNQRPDNAQDQEEDTYGTPTGQPIVLPPPAVETEKPAVENEDELRPLPQLPKDPEDTEVGSRKYLLKYRNTTV